MFDAEGLVEQLRLELDDTVEDYLWSDQELFLYVDLSQKWYAKVTEAFRDSTTPEITQISIAADLNGDYDPLVTFDERIIRVEDAYLETAAVDLDLKNENELLSGWQTETGTPSALVLDYDHSKGRLVPVPDTDDTLLLTVVRYPLKDVLDGGRLEVKDPLHQYALLDGAKHYAYSKNDADVYNPRLAAEYEAKFASNLMQFKSEFNRAKRRLGTVRYGGY